ncbi:catenin delta-1-like isoform X2 [Girardinichthys multiradiatus]|uniref:catenin delta-1-like isoform X2 n=1 Tax=Girardinichthys multiradiatus TaxID=208333 RepID=UPI001FAD646D|nr:catenin delta-1-like isoform X2 [Girardinichthys multiradiatus]
MEQCENAAALLESVREQEVQFEQLTRALEEERRKVGLPATSPTALGHPFPHTQNGCLGDADIERLKLTDSYINGTQYRMVDPAHGALDGSYTPEDESQEVHSVFSEEGTTRRADNGMKKPVSRTVPPSHSSIDGMLSSGMGVYGATLYRPSAVGDYPTATVPRNYHYGPMGGYEDYRGGPPSEAYASLSRGSRMDERYRPVDTYRTLDSGYRAPSRQQLDPYAAQPQVSRGMRALGSALEMRYGHGHYGLEDDQRSMGYDEYGMGPPPMHPGGYGTMPRLGLGPGGIDRRRLRSCEDTLDSDVGGVDPYAWGIPMTLERGSMASLDSTLRKAAPKSWRQPELPEVIAMLNYRLDPVKTNAAAFLQHLTFKNDMVKSEVRRLRGIPALVSMLDHPIKEVHHSACGALKNISYGRDADNKIAIKNCDGVPALVKLLRKTRDQDLTDTITGTLWNLSSHDSVKMEIVDHGLNALANEVIVPHSGWERGGSGGEESCKPRHLEWETSLTNTAGCLRNVSSERSEARRKLRECSGLVDSLMYIVQSQINRKDVDNKLVENCVCLLRNLSYQVHREVPGCERYIEAAPVNQGPTSANKGGCFGSRKGKGKKDGDDGSADAYDFPKRTTPAKGYELLFQPEVVLVYTSLLKESKNPSVLEAAAGALQNLCAGRWTFARYIRAMVRLEKGLPIVTELLAHNNDRVVRAMSGALRNLAIDSRNRDLLGVHALPNLVAVLPEGQSQSRRNLSEETIVSVLSTLAEVLGNNLEAAKKLRASAGIERLVLISKDGNRSDREVRGTGQVLQLIWAHKELRRPLEKDGWKKSDFMVNPSTTTINGPSTRANGTYEDSTTPLLDKGEKRDVIPLNDIGPDAYSTLDQKERRHTLEETTDTLPRGVYGSRKGSLPLLDSYDDPRINWSKSTVVCWNRGGGLLWTCLDL